MYEIELQFNIYNYYKYFIEGLIVEWSKIHEFLWFDLMKLERYLF